MKSMLSPTAEMVNRIRDQTKGENGTTTFVNLDRGFNRSQTILEGS